MQLPWSPEGDQGSYGNAKKKHGSSHIKSHLKKRLACHIGANLRSGLTCADHSLKFLKFRQELISKMQSTHNANYIPITH
jgi:hypothetical protein